MAVIPLHEHSGFAYFICTECGARVLAFCMRGRRPVCALCEFMESVPDLAEETEAHLRAIAQGNADRGGDA